MLVGNSKLYWCFEFSIKKTRQNHVFLSENQSSGENQPLLSQNNVQDQTGSSNKFSSCNVGNGNGMSERSILAGNLNVANMTILVDDPEVTNPHLLLLNNGQVHRCKKEKLCSNFFPFLE